MPDKDLNLGETEETGITHATDAQELMDKNTEEALYPKPRTDEELQEIATSFQMNLSSLCLTMADIGKILKICNDAYAVSMAHEADLAKKGVK